MLEFTIAFFSSCGAVPGILLALALAPCLHGRLVVVLAILDLWLLLEILEILIRADYVFGSHALPRLAASALQVGLAIVVFRCWQRLPSGQTAQPVALHQPAMPRQRPARAHAAAMSGSRAA